MANETILVVEDEKSIAKLIKYNLEKNGYEVLIAKNGEDALKSLNNKSISLALLDIMLPDIDGLEICKQIKLDGNAKHIPIIMLTAKSEEIDRIVGFELGADDYITKPFSPRELVLRIKAILKRARAEEAAPKEVLSAGDVTVNIARHEVMVKDKAIELTRMEFKLLCTLIERRGRVQTRERLLSDVWGIDTMAETRTIDTHVKSLRSKLGKTGRLLETVRGMGYKLADDDKE